MKIILRGPLKYRGVSLISLLTALASSAILLLCLMQVCTVINRSYITSRNLATLYEKARFVSSYLQSEISKGGYAMFQPNYDISVTESGVPHTFRNWRYVGASHDIGTFTGSTSSFSVSTNTFAATAFNANAIFFRASGAGGVDYHSFSNSANPDRKSWQPNLVAGTGNKITAGCAGVLASYAYKATNWQGWSGLCNNYWPNNTCTNDTLNTTYTCGGFAVNTIYERVFTPVNYGNLSSSSPPTAADTLSFTINANSDGSITDCLGTTVSAASTLTSSRVPDATHLFSFTGTAGSNGRLQCTPSGGTATSISDNLEYMYVLAGEDAYGLGNASRYVPFTDVTLNLQNIVSLRIYYVMRSEDPLLTTATSTTFKPLPTVSGFTAPSSFVSPTDRYLRKAFTTTVYLPHFKPSPYIKNCQLGTNGNWYIVTGGIPFVNETISNGKIGASTGYSVCSGSGSNETGTPAGGTGRYTFGSQALCEASRDQALCLQYLLKDT
jgi:hypothetical protein